MSAESPHTTFMSIIKNGFDPAYALSLREQFQTNGYIYIPNFFDSFLAEHFRSYVTPERLQDFYRSQAGAEYVAVDYSFVPEFISEYNYLINQENYIKFLEQATGLGPIGRMQGHIYISEGESKRGYYYHSDHDGNRYFLASINISATPYEGGVFTMRNPKTYEKLYSVHNSGNYGLLLAPIGDDYEHAVSDVVGQATRMTLLSWALKQPVMKRFKMY